MAAAGIKGQAEAKPSEVAKASGTPNSLIVTCSDVETRALRASRSCHERRVCARSARERGEGETTGVAEGGGAIPLTLLAQRAGATTANAGRLDHAQAAIGFSTLLMGVKRLPCWAPERPIGLERKV